MMLKLAELLTSAIQIFSLSFGSFQYATRSLSFMVH